MIPDLEPERKRVEYMRTEKGQQSIPETMFNDFTSPIGTKNLNTKKDQQDYAYKDSTNPLTVRR
jgi:hypothetical protein